MRNLKGMMPSGSMVVALIALIAALGGTAWAAATISGKDIKKDSIRSSKVKDKTLKTRDFSKQARRQLAGDDGATGPAGPQGPVGPGTAATYTNPQWGLIDRNTVGSPVGGLRGGPFAGPGASNAPPLGDGSLGIETASNQEKVVFGNQVDFVGDPVSGLDQVGFSYYVTQEDLDRAAGTSPTSSSRSLRRSDENADAVPGGGPGGATADGLRPSRYP